MDPICRAARRTWFPDKSPVAQCIIDSIARPVFIRVLLSKLLIPSEKFIRVCLFPSFQIVCQMLFPVRQLVSCSFTSGMFNWVVAAVLTDTRTDTYLALPAAFVKFGPWFLDAAFAANFRG